MQLEHRKMYSRLERDAWSSISPSWSLQPTPNKRYAAGPNALQMMRESSKQAHDAGATSMLCFNVCSCAWPDGAEGVRDGDLIAWGRLISSVEGGQRGCPVKGRPSTARADLCVLIMAWLPSRPQGGHMHAGCSACMCNACCQRLPHTHSQQQPELPPAAESATLPCVPAVKPHSTSR